LVTLPQLHARIRKKSAPGFLQFIGNEDDIHLSRNRKMQESNEGKSAEVNDLIPINGVITQI
jgi:hypothetical protein